MGAQERREDPGSAARGGWVADHRPRDRAHPSVRIGDQHTADQAREPAGVGDPLQRPVHDRGALGVADEQHRPLRAARDPVGDERQVDPDAGDDRLASRVPRPRDGPRSARRGGAGARARRPPCGSTARTRSTATVRWLARACVGLPSYDGVDGQPDVWPAEGPWPLPSTPTSEDVGAAGTPPSRAATVCALRRVGRTRGPGGDRDGADEGESRRPRLRRPAPVRAASQPPRQPQRSSRIRA